MTLTPPTIRRRRRCLALALCVAFPAQAAIDPTAMSLEQLMEIRVVTASKYEQRQSEVGAAVSVITRDEIKAFGWRTLDAALISIAGVYRTYDRQYTYLGYRGYALPGDINTRLLVTIDGNRINEATYDGAPFGNEFPLDMSQVERIEFIAGPGGAVYGQNAMLAVVNVITRAGASLGGTELRAGYDNRQRSYDGHASWGRRLDNGADVLVAASGLDARGQDLALAYPGAGPDGSTLSGTAARLDGERSLKLFGRLTAGPWYSSLIHSERKKDDPTGVYFTDPFAARQFAQDTYTIAHLVYQSRVQPNLDVLGRVFAGQYRYDANSTYGGVDYPNGARSDWWGGELRVVWTAIPDHKLMAGIEAQRNSRTDQFFHSSADASQNIDIPGSSYRYGIYAQDEWRLTDAFMATLGLRINHDDITGTNVNPRASLIWQPAAATTIKTLYGRAGRSPNAYERAYGDGVSQVANLSLGAETIDTFELVVDHRAGRDLALRMSVYRWTIKDVVTLGLTADGLPQYQAGGDVDAQGVELSAHKTWTWGGSMRASATYMEARNAARGLLPNAPRVLGKALFSSPLPVPGNVRLGYELQYDGPRRTLDGVTLGGAAVSNLHLMATGLAPRLEASLALYNLFDKHVQHPASDVNWQDALQQDGRTVRLQIAYAF